MNKATTLFFILLSLPSTACDATALAENTAETPLHREAEVTDTEEHAWIVPEGSAPEAVNPDFSADDTVILDELDFPNGARAQIIELPEDAGVGVVWLGGPPEIGGLPAQEYSPLELSQAFGTHERPIPALTFNHEQLAASGQTPPHARDLLALGTTTDPTQATDIEERVLCLVETSAYSFNQHWGFYKTQCPSGTLCGSASNDHKQVVSGNFYIVALPSSKTAILTCNAGTPFATPSSDTLNAQLQNYSGSGNWYTFYTSPAYGTEHGIAFTSYGWTVNQFRMRVYNAGSGTDSHAAAIW